MSPRHDTSYYYHLIRDQESALDDTVLTEDAKKALLSCASDECYRKYFDQFTKEHGVLSAFSLLVLFQKEFPERSRGCHYISHGIGHAALRLSGNDFSKAFDVLESSSYYKNIASCGNGYFHGVVEEYAKDADTEEKLVARLRDVCVNGGASCYHGVGHAATIQLKDEVPGALHVCDAIVESPEFRFECYTGVFMQQASIAAVTVTGGIMHFNMCDAQDERYRVACYLEQSSLYERFSKNPDNYVRNIGFCRQIPDPVNRMACIKLFAIRSVRIAKFEDVRGMCLNTSTRAERVMCTAVTASKIAKSIDKRSPEYDYKKIVWDVCGTIFDPLAHFQCFDLAANNAQKLFYTSPADLTLRLLPDGIFRSVYNRYGG